jgi:hypothetical protein
MILDIKLGIIFGFFILANLQGLVALGAFVTVSLRLLLAPGIACWLWHASFGATRSFLPLLRLTGTVATAAGLVSGALANVLMAFARGRVLQQPAGSACAVRT